MDFRFGQVCVLVASAVGMKTTSGVPLSLGDFFPDLVPEPTTPAVQEPNLRLIRGADREGDIGVVAGWDRWAQICQTVAKRRNRGVVGVA